VSGRGVHAFGQKLSGTPAIWSTGLASRKCDHDGTLQLAGGNYLSATAWGAGRWGLAGGDGTVEVWFGRLLLGWLQPATQSFPAGAQPPLELVSPRPDV